jgi:hypothetical protein
VKRRSFFQSLAKTAAIIALAPQIAFRTPLKAIVAPEPEMHVWEITVNFGIGGTGEPVVRTWRYEAPDDHKNTWSLGPGVEIKEVSTIKYETIIILIAMAYGATMWRIWDDVYGK